MIKQIKRNVYADSCTICAYEFGPDGGWIRKRPNGNGWAGFCESHKNYPFPQGQTVKGLPDGWTKDKRTTKSKRQYWVYISPQGMTFRSLKQAKAAANAGKQNPQPTPQPIVTENDVRGWVGKAMASEAVEGIIKHTTKSVIKDEANLRELIRDESRKVTRRVKITIPTVKPVKIERAHKKLQDVLQRVVAGIPVLLVGPTGSGKTFLAQQVAQALRAEFTFNSMSEGVSESHLLGRMSPAKKGDWTYQRSPFVKTFQEGGVHLFDEIDAADANLLVIANSAIANGVLSLPFAQEKPIIRHDDFRVIAAANTYGHGADREYVGRNQLDAATLNRFTLGTVEVDYDEDLERDLVGSRLDTDKTNELVNWAHKTRRLIREARLRRTMSTRNIEDSAKLMSVGASLEDIKNTFYLGWSTDERAKADK